MFEKINELLDVFLNNKNLKNTKERDLIESVWEEKINSDIKKKTQQY